MNEIQKVVAGAGGGCFRKGARVQLEGGKTVPIEELKVGDEILSFDERGEICKSVVTQTHYHEGNEPILRVRFWRGETYITPNHWVLNAYNSFTEMECLTTNDALVDGLGGLRPIISMELFSHEPVYNLTVEPNHTFICDDIRVHNGGFRERYPTVAGSGGGGGKSKSRTMREDPDSLESKSIIKVIDLLGEGEIGGLVNGAKSIYLDDTPVISDSGVSNFDSVGWQQVTGTSLQRPLEGHDSVEVPYTVNVQIKKETSRTVTITDSNADAVRLVVSVPSLMSQDKNSGDIHGSSVTFRFDISVDEGPYSTLGEHTVTGKTRAKYQRSYLYDLPKPGSTWSIRMVRVSDDSSSSLLSNDTYFDSYSVIIYSKLNYPNSALIGVTVDSAQFSSVPSRSYLVDGLYIRVPSNYTPPKRQADKSWDDAIYDGVWDGTFKTAVSSNPAWIMFDILTNERYGLGNYVSEEDVDVSQLYKIAKYCDELVPDGFGRYEPRFRINTVIQTREEAYQVISDISSVFRGMAYWAGGIIGFTYDAPAGPTMEYSPANVVGGTFTYSGSARKDRYSVALVTWNDPDDYYRQKIEYVEDAELVQKYGIRETEVIAFGCSSRGQAHRAGLYLLYTGKYESDLITFNVGIDSAMVLPGEIIKIHDTTRAGRRMGGRLVSCTTTSATLDAKVTFENAGAVFSVRMPDGTFAERTLLEAAGTYSTVTWNEALPELPVPNAIWMVSSEELEPVLARVVSIKQENQTEYVISAVEHNPSKYDAIEQGLKLEEPRTTIIDTSSVTMPTNFNSFESTYVVAPGVIGSKILLSWTGNAISYVVSYRRLSTDGTALTNWEQVTALSPSYEILNVQSGIYECRVAAVALNGNTSLQASLNHIVIGKTASPGEVLNFKVTKRTYDLLLTWDEVQDIDIAGYEIREGFSWGSSRVVQSRFMGTSCVDDQDKPGTYNYFIRSIDTSGNYSENVTTFVLTLNEPSTVTGFVCVQADSRVEFRWNKNPETDIAGYEIREGNSWNGGTRITEVMATSYTLLSGSISGRRTFWIKAIASPGIESKAAAFYILDVVTPLDRNIVVEINEKDTEWRGTKRNTSIAVSDLVLDEGKSYGEYIFPVTLPKTFNARNSVFATFDAITADGEAWKNAIYSWGDATRPWIYAGNLGDVAVEFYISRFVGHDDNIIESFTLNGTGYGEINNTPPAQSKNVYYSDGGAFAKGVSLQQSTLLDWDVETPETFSLSFWVTPKDLDSGDTIWSALFASGERMVCGFDKENSKIYLEHGEEVIAVDVHLAVNDKVHIGIVQTATERRLYVGVVNGESAYAIGDFAPVGKIMNVGLHG